ncbi:MAG: hypothetical protein FWF36_06790 [Propionibacteriaceae bacterium]|nr:hypothetical protein [Propionibacteriaceae bacterium]
MFPRDREFQPDWYAEMLDKFLADAQVKVDARRLRDEGWALVGQATPESYGSRLVVLPSGVGVMSTGGFSVPDAKHPGPGFEMFMPSVLFAGDAESSRHAWPFNGLNQLVRHTDEKDIDWTVEAASGPVAVTYVASYSNDAPDDWRADDPVGRGDLCGVLVGVPCPGIPNGFPGLGGMTALIGVIPARPAEWEFLQQGGADRRTLVAQHLARLGANELASPTRPSVI